VNTLRQALLLAAFDSQLKWCGRLRDELAQRGFATSVVVPDMRSALSAAQIRAAGFDEVHSAPWGEVMELALRSDVVVCGLSGPIAKAFCFALADRLGGGATGSPVVVTGWVGVIIEKLVAGYLDRCGSDLVAVNARPDLELFIAAARRLALPTDNLLLAGLPFLSPVPRPVRDDPVRRVLFADQPTVPSSDRERLYLYRQLLRYAARHPEREVLLKPRHRRGEDTFHRMRHHPEDLLSTEVLPANFRIDHTPVSDILPRVDLLLTVSSTACLEAVAAGCRVGLVLDLGIHERYGNHVFLDSGLLRTFAELERDEIGAPDPTWLAGYFLGRERTATHVIGDQIEELLASGDRPSRAVWDSDYFRGAARAHRALEPDLGSRAPRPGRYGTVALRRRQRRLGPVRGAVAHLSSALVPPILTGPLRTAGRKAGLR